MARPFANLTVGDSFFIDTQQGRYLFDVTQDLGNELGFESLKNRETTKSQYKYQKSQPNKFKIC